MTSELIVLGFEGEYQAEGMLDVLLKMQERGLLKLEDAVAVKKTIGGELELSQTLKKHSGRQALKGAGLGLLAGAIIGLPIVGLAAGAGILAARRSMKDYGIDDEFIKEVSSGLRPESSELFLLVKEAKGPEVLEEMRKFKAIIIKTTLSDEQRSRLEKALEKEEF
jgi:uncharacterized membrane protein